MTATALEHPRPALPGFLRAAAIGSDREPAWLGARRKEAVARFSALGFPTQRLEAWKYTNVARIARTGWEPGAGAVPGLSRASLEERILPVFACNLLVFVNNQLVPELSAPALRGGGLRATSLARALAEAPGPLEEHLARHARFDDAAFATLNTACFTDGAFVHLPRGEEVLEPLHLVYVAAPGPRPTVSHPRTLIVAEPGSRATIIEDFVGFGSGPCFTNALSEVVVGEDAELQLVRLQREGDETSHVSTVEVVVGRNARFACHSVSLSGALIRNDLGVRLAEAGAGCHLLGLFVTRDGQHVDNHTLVLHEMPHGTSRELYKGILDGESRGIFHGRIVVRPDAQHTDARQESKNLLLSDRAEIDTKPQLEIHADDVKCSHGSSIGSIDEDALFYLRSRGLDEATARGVLTRGFATEVVDAIPVEAVREVLGDWLQARLGAAQQESP